MFKELKNLKICLVCSHGGHLTEMKRIIPALTGFETFYITYRSKVTSKLPRSYLLENIGKNPFIMFKAFVVIAIILLKERPKIILSTGSEIAIPAFYVAKVLRIKTMFVESWCRTKTPSGTGKFVYPIADYFLVQWPTLLSKYGRKAMFCGAVA